MMFWFRPKGDPILLRQVWVLPKEGLYFTAAVPCIDTLVSPKGRPHFLCLPKENGEKKGHPERLLFLIPVRFSGRQKNRFFEQARKINTFFA
ncbi:hypothetical protein [Gallibacterium anatis]|uniref:hypothetical protein n=1 Tax=Gallibacterium anatis TaxID=750 RepID=UPI0039FC7F75